MSRTGSIPHADCELILLSSKWLVEETSQDTHRYPPAPGHISQHLGVTYCERVYSGVLAGSMQADTPRLGKHLSAHQHVNLVYVST